MVSVRQETTAPILRKHIRVPGPVLLNSAVFKKLPTVNGCGETRWNCIVMADGHVEPLRLPGDAPELLIEY